MVNKIIYPSSSIWLIVNVNIQWLRDDWAFIAVAPVALPLEPLKYKIKVNRIQFFNIKYYKI